MRNKKASIPKIEDIVTCPGDPVRIEYSPHLKEDGTIELIPTNKIDIQEEINSYRDECDISSMIMRYQMGDQSALSKNPGMYADFTNLPDNMHDLLNLGLRAQNEFYKLPIDVRAKFGNSFYTWLSSVGDDEWIAKMGFEVPAPVDVVKPVVDDVKPVVDVKEVVSNADA